MLDFRKLELNTTEPVYVQIVSFVKRQIFTGAAEKGESLPSRRELAAILKINPNTVQKAFRLMEEEKIIETPPHAVSVIHWDDAVFARLRRELTAGLVADFVAQAKENGLTLQTVTELLQEEWGRGMKNVWKLSNYLYGWLWQKWTKAVTLVSMILAVCFLIAAAVPTGDPKAYDYYPKVFRSYDMVIDHSLLPILFALGLVLILIGIFVQIKGFSTNGKGIYTMLLLPMKRHEVYFAFVLSAAAAVALYYLLWLVLMVAAYFPLMSFYKMQAAKEIFVLTRDNIVTGLDASRTNGLFLAFHRSTFLDMVFPSSFWRVVPALGGFALIFTGIFFAGFCTENKVTAVLGSSAMLLCGGYLYLHDVVKSLNPFYANPPIGRQLILGIIALVAAIWWQDSIVQKLGKRTDL